MIFTKIISWITDSRNSTTILFIIIALLIGLFFYQRSRTQTFKFKYDEQVKETSRINNNWKADGDTIRLMMDKNGKLTGEISGYKITQKELTSKYDSLFSLYKWEKNKPPKVIIEYRYILSETLTKVPTEVEGDSLIIVYDSINYGDGNWRIIQAKIPFSIVYRIKSDSVNSFEFIKALKYAFELQQLGIKDAFVVLYENNKRTSYINSKNVDSLIYRVQIYATNIDFTKKQIADKFNLKEEDIYKTYEDGIYKYMTGMFVPKLNINPIISLDELNSYAQLNAGLSNINLNIGMKLGSSLLIDSKTGEIIIRVSTKYPGITFEDIRGAEIMSSIKSNNKVSRSFRKEWGIGFNLGLGMMPVAANNTFQLRFGPVMSVGINYTPRWLQFGPSQTGKNTISDFINGN